MGGLSARPAHSRHRVWGRSLLRDTAAQIADCSLARRRAVWRCCVSLFTKHFYRSVTSSCVNGNIRQLWSVTVIVDHSTKLTTSVAARSRTSRCRSRAVVVYLFIPSDDLQQSSTIDRPRRPSSIDLLFLPRSLQPAPGAVSRVRETEVASAGPALLARGNDEAPRAPTTPPLPGVGAAAVQLGAYVHAKHVVRALREVSHANR